METVSAVVRNEASSTGIPRIDTIFDLERRIGRGTFSSVYLATLKRDKRRRFAIKKLIPTSNPRRIEAELRCMVQIGGCDNVAGIEACVRHGETVAFVMNYVEHVKFHEFFDKMQPTEVREYMRNLLLALRRVHSFNVIHRDIKPSNFLYNRKRREFMLVDFGLAQDVKDLKAEKRKQEEPEDENLAHAEGKPPKRIKGEKGAATEPIKGEKSAISSPPTVFKSPLKQNSANMTYCETPPLATAIKSTCLGLGLKIRMMEQKNKRPTLCACYGKSQVCTVCIVKRECVASRAGTPGYRPPEVLLKYAAQTTAVDMWAAGVIFLSILSRSYPFFHSHDDYSALAELITVFGDKKIKHLALSLGRHMKIGHKKPPLSLKRVCVRLRTRGNASTADPAVSPPPAKPKCSHCQQEECLCAANQAPLDDADYSDAAYDLLAKMLELDPSKRISAAQALEHPYFLEAVV